MVRTKVFVGNLSFKTVEAELAHQFAAAGAVVSANIITRGPRSLGYGFVEFEDEPAAQNAVKLMNKKEIDGRPINVEIAKPREEGEEKKEGGSGAPSGRGAPRGRGRGGFRGRGRGFRGGFSSRGGGGAAPAPAKKAFYKSEMKEEEEDDKPRRGGFRRRRGGPRRGRGGRREGADNREESKTTLFVANLPFKFNDDDFGKVFSDNNLKFKSAHVVKKRNGLSKGYGFAEFDNEADQQKALKEIHGKIVDGRDLSVKVALTDNREDNGKEEEDNQEKKEPATEKKQDSGKKDSPKAEKKEEKK